MGSGVEERPMVREQHDAAMTETPRQLRIEMPSQPKYLAGVRAFISSLALRFGFSENACSQIALALDEALCNVINHGYHRREDGPIWISVWPMGEPVEGIRILVEDEGEQVDPASIRSRDLDDIRPGGLGVYIINQIMDVVEFRTRNGKGMSLLMEKRLTGGRAGATCGSGSETCSNG